MDSPRIQHTTAPTQRVQATRDGESKRKEEEVPEFHMEGDEERRPDPDPDKERERGDVASRSDDESGGRLDVIA